MSIVKIPYLSRYFFIISLLLIFSLPIEYVPLPVQAQILPLTSLLAVLFLPIVIRRIYITPLFKIVIVFCGFLLIHSIIALFIDFVILNTEEIRVFAWFRQVVALFMGISVFLVLRMTLVNMSDKFIVQTLILGSLPIIGIALLNLLWGVTGNVIASKIVISIRTALDLKSWASRASGLSLEPAHFAFYLTVITFPAIFSAFILYKKRKLLLITLFICNLIAFMWTKSASGLFCLLGLLVTGIIFGPNRKLFIGTIGIILVGTIFFINLFPNSYIVFQLHNLFTGNLTVSAIDRFYSTFGPFIKIFSSYVLYGYGLGGTATHFKEILPESVVPIIASVRWEKMPTLGNLVGRIFAETGFIGLSLFALIFFMTFYELKAICQNTPNQSKATLPRVAALALFAFLIGATVGGHGSFALPYLWFWLAVIDSRYIRYKKIKGWKKS